ncbi:GNAT family N-acetyltransferase [Pseudonocardia spinosispora]|uniref:GNAT family N-acetyltransferase n=1 Tax=Pseudonocardia spinosispora TaxID=103441 RepID=UPI00041FA7D9|nr:GNAT family N-acyltransferase [Pseudonocardia spinosispora]
MTQAQLLVSTPPTEQTGSHSRYSLLLTRNDADVDAAQRLRYDVFAGELGATLSDPVNGRDVDRFDEYCDHLVVRADSTGEIVGTYRMLPPERAIEAGGYYSETEFDLSAFADLRPSLVEAGRSCVHPDHRSGAVVSLVWAGIARYLLLTGHTHLTGCASVPLADGGALARGVWDVAKAKHLSPPELRVDPLHPWDSDAAPRPERTVIPPLLRGYLRLGAWVCGPGAHDPEFGVADFLVLLSLDRIDSRYLRFFLGAAA